MARTNLNTPLGTAITAANTQLTSDATALTTFSNTFSSADLLRPLSEFVGRKNFQTNRLVKIIMNPTGVDQ